MLIDSAFHNSTSQVLDINTVSLNMSTSYISGFSEASAFEQTTNKSLCEWEKPHKTCGKPQNPWSSHSRDQTKKGQEEGSKEGQADEEEREFAQRKHEKGPRASTRPGKERLKCWPQNRH